MSLILQYIEHYPYISHKALHLHSCIPISCSGQRQDCVIENTETQNCFFTNQKPIKFYIRIYFVESVAEWLRPWARYQGMRCDQCGQV